MSVIVLDENKNASITLTNDSKNHNETWASRTESWQNSAGSWGVPGIVIMRDAKNTITVSNEAKH